MTTESTPPPTRTNRLADRLRWTLTTTTVGPDGDAVVKAKHLDALIELADTDAARLDDLVLELGRRDGLTPAQAYQRWIGGAPR